MIQVELDRFQDIYNVQKQLKYPSSLLELEIMRDKHSIAPFTACRFVMSRAPSFLLQLLVGTGLKIIYTRLNSSTIFYRRYKKEKAINELVHSH